MALSAIVSFFAGSLTSLLNPVSVAANRVAYNLAPVNLLSAVAYAEGYRLKAVTRNQYYQYMRELGFSPNQARVFFKTTDSFLTSEQNAIKRIANSMNKVLTHYDENPDTTFDQGTLDPVKKEYYQHMRKIGFRENESESLYESLRPVPTFSVLLEWLAKEAFEPEVIAKFGLTEDYPQIFDSILESLKVPSNERVKYWTSHWNHPAPGQMLEMYRRLRSDRDDINPAFLSDTNQTKAQVEMTQDDLEQALKLQEIPSYWRSRLQIIGFNALPLSVLQGAYVYGLKDDAWFQGRLRDYGYARDDASFILGYWRRKYPYASKAPISQNILLQLTRGTVNKQDAIDRLKLAGIPTDAAEFVAELAEDKKIILKEKNNITSWKKLYRSKNITDDNLLNLIKNTISDEGRAVEIMSIVKSTEDGAFIRVRLTDIRRGLKAGTITEDDARAKITDLRLFDEDIDLFLELFPANVQLDN